MLIREYKTVVKIRAMVYYKLVSIHEWDFHLQRSPKHVQSPVPKWLHPEFRLIIIIYIYFPRPFQGLAGQKCLDMRMQMFCPHSQHCCLMCGAPCWVFLLHSEHTSAAASPPDPGLRDVFDRSCWSSFCILVFGAFAMPTTFTLLGSNTQSSSRPLRTALRPQLGGTQAVS